MTAQMFCGKSPRICSLINPLFTPCLSNRNDSLAVVMPTLSHSVLSARGCEGGVRPKSPGFRLCAGLPVYFTRFARRTSSSESQDSRIRRFGLKLWRRGIFVSVTCLVHHASFSHFTLTNRTPAKPSPAMAPSSARTSALRSAGWPRFCKPVPGTSGSRRRT